MFLRVRIVTLIERKSRMSMDSLWLALCLLPAIALATAGEPFGMYQEQNRAISPIKNKISENKFTIEDVTPMTSKMKQESTADLTP